MLLKFIFCFSFLSIGLTTFSQTTTQVLRGTVIDKVSESPIPGAKVIMIGSDPIIGTFTDVNGEFKLENIPVGRVDLLTSYETYETSIRKGIILNAGKETVLTIYLEESFKQINEVEVIGKRNGPINEMSVVSTRTFSTEETQKYAAAMNDPARMATSFPGVVATNGLNNDISIRGNSPLGIIWRMEGIEIPNPNHFSAVGSSGGGISIISAQLMGTSDFSTGAFAAEYGNALSGVFDLSLRKGNNQQTEFTFQAGVLGLDAAIEGPFKKGYNGSYLINYRYSTLGILQHIVPIDDGETNFQDISFNFFFPTKKIGNFGVFGFGGLSDQTYRAEKDTALWQIDPNKQYEGVFLANTGMIGAWHKMRFGKNAYLQTNLGFSSSKNSDYSDSVGYDFINYREFEEHFVQNRFTLSTKYILKLSRKNNLKAGIIFNRIGFVFKESDTENGVTEVLLNSTGSTYTLQSFAMISHKFSDVLKVNAGLHYLHLFLNNSYSIEPRATLSYQLSKKHTLNFGYGLHGQIQPLGTYFGKGETSTLPNRDLEISKAHHFILSHSAAIGKASTLRTEVYYQHLYNLPIGTAGDSTFSLANSQWGYENSPLISRGIGRNIGIELTLDRRLKNNFYYLIAASISESKYRALNNQWYSTRFNTNYSFNVTTGKEWVGKNEKKRRTYGLNLKSTLVGGMRFTPLNILTINDEIYLERDYSRSYDESMPAFFRVDLRLSLKRDYKKVTSTLSLDLRNVLNRSNVAGQYYNWETGELNYYHHPGILPVLSYQLAF